MNLVNYTDSFSAEKIKMSIGNRKALKKAFSILTAVTTILSLSGVAMIAPVSAATPADYGLKEGDVISAAGSSDPDVYIVNEHGYKRLFLNPAIFNFYGHLGGFAAVKNVTPTVRDAFPTSGLFRVDGDQKVYGVEVTGEDVAVLHWVNTTGAQAVADDPNFFKKVFVINQNEFAWYTKGSDYTSVNQIPSYARGTTTPAPTGSFSASVASSNPASGTLLETQALADLAHFNVMGSGKVTSVELGRLGVSGDTTVDEVFLFVNGVRVSDAANFASGVVKFANGNGLFTAPATVSVRANVADSTSGQTVGVKITSVNGTSVNASGNVMTIAANPATLATIAVGSATGPGNFDPQKDVNVWQSTFTVSNEDVWLKRFTIREIGSIDNNHVTNLRLFVDGIQVATASGLDADGYATFITNSKMLTGARTVKVVADVVGGSSRTMQFSLRYSYDVEALDESYMVAVEPTGVSSPVSATASTVGSASVTAVKASDSPSGDVVDSASDVVLAKYTLTAYGEAVKVETLQFRASVSDSNVGSLRNGRVLINGSQFGSTQTLSETASTSYTVNYTLQPGVPVTVEVRADVHDNDGTDNLGSSDVISILMDGSSNAQGVSSATSVSVPSSSTSVESNNVTVTTGSMTLAKFTGYSNQTVSIPASALKVGSYTLTGSSSETINLNTIEVGWYEASEWDVDSTVTDVYVKYGNNTSSLKSSVSTSASSSWSISYPLAKNESLTLEVYANVSNFSFTAGGDTLTTKMKVSGTTSSSSTSVTSNATGQTMTAGSGTFSTSVDAAAAKLAYGGSTVSGATFRFRADNESLTVSELLVRVASGSEDSVASLILKRANGTTIQTLPLTVVGDDFAATFDDLSEVIPANSEITLVVDVVVANIGVGGGSTGDNVAVTLDHAKYKNSSGVETTDSTERAGANIYAHRSFPVVATQSLGTSTLGSGEQSIAKFTVTPTGNSIGVKRLRFDISKSSALSITSSSYKILEGGADISGVASISAAQVGAGQTSGSIIVEFNDERTLSSATTYELKVQVGVWAADSFLTATLAEDSATASPAAYASVSAAAKFTWSDRSASSHSATTSDWMNGYLVDNLSLTWSLNS